jgi:FxsC-like protein
MSRIVKFVTPLPPSVPPYFFLSYARSDDDAYVEQFFEDLSGEVRVRAGLTRGETVGFLDRSSIEVGALWSKDLVDALSTCTTFVGLCSPRYIASEPCGQEWHVFEKRCRQFEEIHGHRSTALLPALWLPPRRMPPAVQRVQYDQTAFGDAYRRDGLRQLMRLNRYHDEYLVAVSVLAQHIVDNGEIDRLPPVPAAERLEFASAPSAFHVVPTGDEVLSASSAKPRDVHFIVAAPSRDEARTIRHNLEFYGELALDWAPYGPTHAVPLAGFAREIAARRGLTASASAISLAPESTTFVDPGTGMITVLLVDAWTTQLDTYRNALARHEDRRAATAAMVPRNPEDTETHEHWRRLSDGLRSLFLDRIASGESLTFRSDILTHRAFDEDLQIVLETARNRSFAHGTGTVATSEPGMARPILEGP